MALDPITGGEELAGKITDFLGRFIPDKSAAAAAAAELQENVLAGQLKADSDQRDINKIEAQSPNLFVAGWRPGLGWVGVIALFCYYVPYVLVATVLWSAAVIHTGQLQPRPDLGITDLLGLMGTLLGMGGLRSIDKFNGVDTKGVAILKGVLPWRK